MTTRVDSVKIRRRYTLRLVLILAGILIFAFLLYEQLQRNRSEAATVGRGGNNAGFGRQNRKILVREECDGLRNCRVVIERSGASEKKQLQYIFTVQVHLSRSSCTFRIADLHVSLTGTTMRASLSVFSSPAADGTALPSDLTSTGGYRSPHSLCGLHAHDVSRLLSAPRNCSRGAERVWFRDGWVATTEMMRAVRSPSSGTESLTECVIYCVEKEVSSTT